MKNCMTMKTITTPTTMIGGYFDERYGEVHCSEDVVDKCDCDESQSSCNVFTNICATGSAPTATMSLHRGQATICTVNSDISQPKCNKDSNTCLKAWFTQ